MGIIYQLTFANGKKYIGQTVQSLDARVCRHRVSSKKDRTLIAHAFRKHGDPRAEVLAEIPESQMNELERFAIAEAGTLSPGGYNLLHGGQLYSRHHPETLQKMREGWSEERRAAMSAVHKGKKKTASTREKMSVAVKARPKKPVGVRKQSTETRQKMRDTWSVKFASGFVRKSVKRSPEARARMSAAQQRSAAAHPPEWWTLHAQRTSLTSKGRVHSAETRQKMSDAMKGRVVTDQHRERLRIAALAREQRKRETSLLPGANQSCPTPSSTP